MAVNTTRIRDKDGRIRPLHPKVIETIWEAIQTRIPPHVDNHPKNGHNPRIEDKTCLKGIIIRLVFGCSWEEAGALINVSESTLMRRFKLWEQHNVFQDFAIESIKSYDKMIGLDLSDVSLDGSIQKAPLGGDGVGPSPVDRAKIGWKFSIICDDNGICIGWDYDGANKHDSKLLASTIESIAKAGILPTSIGTLHLDKGYDSKEIKEYCKSLGVATDIQTCNKRGPKPKNHQTTSSTNKPNKPQKLDLGKRWVVERTNSWLTNFGQIRRSTERQSRYRGVNLALAIGIIITIKLIKWAKK